MGAARGQRPAERVRLPDRARPADPDAAYVVPEEGAENRVTPDGRLGVYRTRDGGASWELLENGLPQQAWQSVMREGMSFDRLDPVGIYLGTQSGSVWVSPDAGGEWIEAARVPADDPLRRGGRVAVILLPSLLARGSGRRRSLRDRRADRARRAAANCRSRDLLFDERGELRPLVNVYVNSVQADDLEAPLEPETEIRLVAAVAGG